MERMAMFVILKNTECQKRSLFLNFHFSAHLMYIKKMEIIAKIKKATVIMENVQLLILNVHQFGDLVQKLLNCLAFISLMLKER